MDHEKTRRPEREGDSEPAPVRLEDLGALIRGKRRAGKLTLEEAARQSGVSAPTLSRLERQGALQEEGTSTERLIRAPDTRTLAAITRWLGVSLNSISNFESPPLAHTVAHHQGENTPDIVEAHLRADRNLDPATAGALARMFRAAYEQFADFKPAPTTRNRPEGKIDNEPDGSGERNE